MLLRGCSFLIDWTVSFQEDLMKYWTRCHWSAMDVGLWEMRKRCFVNSLDLCEGKHVGTLVKENHSQEKTWQVSHKCVCIYVLCSFRTEACIYSGVLLILHWNCLNLEVDNRGWGFSVLLLLSSFNPLNISIISLDTLLLYSHFRQYYQMIDFGFELGDFSKKNMSLQNEIFICHFESHDN